MDKMALDDALRILRSAGQVAFWDADGCAVPVTVTGTFAGGITGTAPRFTVSGGQVLSTRVMAPDGEPFTVRMVVERADYESAELASVCLQLQSAELDPLHRRSPRLQSGGSAWLTALNCQDVVDGDRVDASIVDVSASGVAFSSNRVLRRGDYLLFHGRFFAETVESEVRVASIRAGAVPERTIYGCEFVGMEADSSARLERILSGERRPGVDLTAIHELVESRRSVDGGGRRRRFLRR